MATRTASSESQLALISGFGVIAPPPIHVETPRFNGSLATLFQFVKDRKVDLLEIPLFPICTAYYQYLIDTEQLGLDEAAAALTALAYLLERKAWALIPINEEEPELESSIELPEPYVHEFQIVIEELRSLHEERSGKFFRPIEAGPDPYELPFTLGEVNANDLVLAFNRLLDRAISNEVEILNKPRRSLSDQMKLVFVSLRDDWLTLDVLVIEPFSRSEAVWWFLALLELIRLGQAKVKIEEQEVFFARAC